MAGRSKKSLDFTINVDFATKASKEIDTYVNKLTELKKQYSERLSGGFIDDTIKKLQQGQKTLQDFNRTVNNPKMSKQDRFNSIGTTAEEMKGLSRLMKNLDKIWMTDAIKNNDKVLKQLDEIHNKQKQLSSIKGNITKNQNSMTRAENELRGTGYTGGTTAADARSLQVKVNKNKKVLGAEGNFDNKDLIEENKLLEKQIELIDKIVKGRKKGAEYNKQVSSLSAIDGRAGVTDTDTASKRLETKEQSLLAQSDTTENIAKMNEDLAVFNKLVPEGSSHMEAFGSVGSQVWENTEEEIRKTQETTQTLKQVLAQFGIGIGAVQIVNYFKDLTQAAFEFYRSLDAAFNEIYVVSGMTSDAVMGLKDDFIIMSKESGMALDDITRSAVLYYQQGLDTNAVLEMTEVTAQFAKVAGIDATDAADKLTAAVNGYCLAAEDAALVADKFNQVAAASAADIDELSTAFSKAAAQANQAGVGMDNYLAYIATMVEATREAPENIGTSLKTIMSRMQQVKMSGSTDDGETDVNQVETALKSVGVALRDANNELRDLEEVFADLGPKWQSLDRNTQAYIGTIVAGTRQQSRFITLMQNWDRVLELSEESQNSAGMQALMHQKAMESLDTSIQQLTNAWQTFLSNLTNSDAFKTIIDLATKLLSVLGKGNAPIVVLSTAIAILSKNLVKLNGPIQSGIKKIGEFGKTLKRLPTLIKSSGKSMTDLRQDVIKAEKAYKDAEDTLGGLQKKFVDLTASGEPTVELTEDQAAAVRKLGVQFSGTSINAAQLTEAIQKQGLVVNQTKTAYENAQIALQQTANASQTLISSGTTLVGILTTVLGALGLLDTTAGGVTVGLAEIGIAVVALIPLIKAFWTAYQAGIAAGTTATVAFKTALDATGIGLILSAIALAVAGITTLVTSLVGAGEKAAQAIKDSVNNIGDAMESMADVKTALTAADRLMEKYNELSSKVKLTKDEQAELNDTVQKLGDAYGIETMADAYGNLSINIAEVNEKMEEEREKLAELEEELEKAEKDGRKDNKFQLIEYYDKLFAKERSSYKSLLDGIDTEYDTSDLDLSAQEIENVSTNLKNAILDNAEELAVGLDDETVSEYIQRINDELNDAVTDDAWGDYYKQMDYFKDSVNELSYGEMQDQLDEFFQNFAHECGLTTEQVELLRKAMNRTLYGDSNLDETINQLEDSIDKQKILMEKQQEIDEKYKKHWYNYLADGLGLWTVDMIFGTNMGSMGRDVHKFQDSLMAQAEVAGMDTSETEKLIAVLSDLNAASATAMETINAYSDIVDKDGTVLMTATEFLSNMDIKSINDAFASSDADGIAKVMDNLQKQIDNADSTELKMALQNKLDAVVKDLTLTPHISWGDLHESLDEASADLRSMNSIMSEFEETGGITLDTFADLCDILDGIDLAAVFDAGMMDEYLTALDQLNLGFDASTGYITAEGDAMQTLQEIQEIATKAEIQSQINKLEVRKASLQSQLAMIEAEMATNEALISYLAQAGDAEIEIESLKTMANAQYAQNMGTAAEKITGYYTTLTSNSSQWATVAIENAAKVGDAFNKLASGELNSATAQQYLNGLMKDVSFQGIDKSGLEGLANGGDTVKASSALGALQEYQTKLGNTYSEITAQIKTIDGQITFLNKLKEMDLGKLGAEGKGDSKEIDKYIGKLMEIYNILNKIETAEHRLSTLETYASSATGKAYANNLQERIKLSKQLMGNYDALIKSQKDLVASEQKAIKDSPVGDVFSFDKYGTIQIDYEKYLALQDESIDGEMTLKELADNMYDEYQELYETQQEYFDRKIDYLEQVIELEQEQVDAYVELEHDLADAVKDIYQDMLDEKLAAIDKEMEALDDLQAAYEEANQARDDSREMSKLQTDLRRSMMDTSGASNTKQLSYQDQIRQKLEDMGEDEYTKRLDDIRTALEDQQEMLQEQFDKFFEDYEELYKMIEERILGSESAVNEVLQTTSDWKEAAPAERQQMLTAWNTRYETAMSGLTGGATIMDVVTDIELLQGSIDELDKTMQQNGDPSRIGKEISTALTEYYLSKEGGGSGDGGDSSFKAGGGGVKVSGSPSKADLSEYDTTVDLSTLDQASSKMDEIKEKIGGWWDKVKEFFANIGTGIADFFTKTIPEKWGAFKQWLSTNVGKYFTAEFWGEKWDTVSNAVTNFFTVTIPEKWGVFTTWLSENVGKYFTPEFWGEKFGIIAGHLYNFFTITVPEKWNEFWTWFNTKMTEIGTAISTFFTKTIPNFFTKLFTETIPQKWTEFTTWLTEKKDALINAISTFFTETVPNFFTTLFTETIPQKWDEFTTWLGEKKDALVNGVKTFFTETIPDFFTKLFTETIPQKWNEFTTWLTEKKDALLNGVKKFFTETIPNAIGQAKDAIVGVIKGILNAGIGIINGVLNGVETLYNKSIGSFLGGLEKGFEKVTGKDLNLPTTLNIPDIPTFLTGGLADFTGPAWLDGTKSEPEAVLNAAQTKAFMRIADNLDKLEGITNVTGGNSAVNIENITFQVESMSSPEDGEAAFNAFITKFKEIGSQSGLNVWQTRKA